MSYRATIITDTGLRTGFAMPDHDGLTYTPHAGTEFSDRPTAREAGAREADRLNHEARANGEDAYVWGHVVEEIR